MDPNIQTNHGSTALMQAVLHNRLDIIQTLLDCKRINPNIQSEIDGQTALSLAQERGHKGAIDLLSATDWFISPLNY